MCHMSNHNVWLALFCQLRNRIVLAQLEILAQSVFAHPTKGLLRFHKSSQKMLQQCCYKPKNVLISFLASNTSSRSSRTCSRNRSSPRRLLANHFLSKLTSWYFQLSYQGTPGGRLGISIRSPSLFIILFLNATKSEYRLYVWI